MVRRVARWLWGRDVEVGRPWRAAPVSVCLLALLVLVFVAERLSGPWQAQVTDLRHVLGWAEPEISDGQVWRLLTSGFLHSDTTSRVGPYGFEHLIANLALLVVVAPRLEARLRPLAFLAFVMALQIVSFSAWAWHDTPVYFGVGASGWLSGIAGAVAVDALRHWREERLYAIATLVWIAWFLLDPAISATSEQVHVFGLVGGAIYGALAMRSGSRLPLVPPVALGALCAVALVPITWHAIHVGERPAVQYGDPAVVRPCSEDPGRPRPGSDGAIEILNQTGERVWLAQPTAAGARHLMVLHPDERIVGGLPVGTRLRLERADDTCITGVEVSGRPTTLRLRPSARRSPTGAAAAQAAAGWRQGRPRPR